MEVDSTTINSTQSLHAEIEREIISDFLGIWKDHRLILSYFMKSYNAHDFCLYMACII